jgi:hypothetical protein
MSENILDKAKAAAQSLTEKVTNFSEGFGESDKDEIINLFKGISGDRVEEMFANVDKFKSLFSEAGYEVGGINVSLGLPPDISISFKFLGSVDDVKRNEIELKVAENKLASIILKSLFKASDFTEKVKLGEMKLNSINIKLGLIPSISLSLS